MRYLIPTLIFRGGQPSNHRTSGVLQLPDCSREEPRAWRAPPTPACRQPPTQRHDPGPASGSDLSARPMRRAAPSTEKRRYVAALRVCPARCDKQESGPGHPSDWRRIEPMEDHSQGRLRVYMYLVILTGTGCPAAQPGLDGDLARLQRWTAPGGWPCSRTRGKVRCPAGAASCPRSVPRRPPPCATAVRRAAAAWCGGFPRARCARFLLCARALPGRIACAVTRRQARGAQSAPLKP